MFSKKDLHQLFDSFNKLKIIIVGDIMVDSYIWGSVDRISPEAPVPVVMVKERGNRLGGAANVAVNVKALGAEPIICSVIGKDVKGKELIELMKHDNMPTHGIVKSKNRTTTTKFRVIGNNVQMLRVDEEITDNLNSSEEDQLIEIVSGILQNEEIDAIIFQDYNKGILTKNIISAITKLANQYQVITAVDPKKKHFEEFKNVTFFKPNLKELREGIQAEVDPTNKQSLEEAALVLHEKLNARIIMTTLSERGVFISAKNNGGSFSALSLPAHIRSISDVSGAGDTVIAVATLCLALKQEPNFIASISNLAGGLVCEYVGVVPIKKEKLLEESQKLFTK